MPLIQAQVIEKYGWLTVEEFTNLITISEMTPGPIAINSATFVSAIKWPVSGRIGCDGGMYSPLLHLCYPAGMDLYPLSQSLTAAGDPDRPASRSSCNDRQCWTDNFDPRFFQKWFDFLRTEQFPTSSGYLLSVHWYCCAVLNGDPVLVMVLCGVCEVAWQLVTGALV